MTRRSRTNRSVENRLAALETDEENELGWFDLMDYAHHCAEHDEDALTRDEYFGEGWVMPDWVDDLRARQRENDRRRENGEL